MHVPSSSTGSAVDLTNCDREPIHIPGAIQPHGVLFFVREATFEILQVSDNVSGFFGRAPSDLLGRPLEMLLRPEQAEQLLHWLSVEDLRPAAPLSLPLEAGTPARRFDVIAHRSGGGLVLEFLPVHPQEERPLRDAHPMLQESISRLQQAASIQDLCRAAVREVRRLTQIDRAKVYRFDADWHGHVIAEDRADHMETYLGLHFPATDIPAQARRLYTLNRIRFIPDAGYRPAALVPAVNPLTDAPLDLSYSVLRSVSPVHIEYLQNMDVAASLSISIVKDGKLWGLIACHHAAPLRLPYQVLVACELLGQVLALLLSVKQDVEHTAYAAQRKAIQQRLVEAMIRADDLVEGLAQHEADLLGLVDAPGVVIYSDERCVRMGQTPGEEAVGRLIAWLEGEMRQDLFHSDALPGRYPEAEDFADVASGVLAVSLSRLQTYYLVWFRPEVPQTVSWAGNPNKPALPGDGELRLHPRKSFAVWKDTLRGRSLPWKRGELEAARELRRSITDVVLVKAEELSRLNATLTQRNRELQDFAFVASHDLQEPLRKIRAFAGLLVEEYEARMDEHARFYLGRMQDAAERASDLIADLLTFSRITARDRPFEPVDLNRVLKRVSARLAHDIAEGGGRLEVPDPLPVIEADPKQMRMLLHNLLDNACKFRRPDAPLVIRVQARLQVGRGLPGPGGQEVCRLEVSDNGIGFEEKYLDRIFSPFQRLHSRSRYPGTGIGLAVCQRIVERHHGTISAESTPGEGATFIVTLPVRHG